MEIILADYAGFCYGVKNAIRKAELASKENNNKIVYTYGSLIHNRQEIQRLANKNIQKLEDIDELTDQDTLIIRSHGVGKTFFKLIKDKEYSFKIIDATCPDVKKAQLLGEKYSDNGYQVLVFGDGKHPEVEGILDWSGINSSALYNEEEARTIKLLPPTILISQTTQDENKFFAIRDILLERDFSMKIENTICSATKNRQEAVKKLALTADVMLIIGSTESSNSNKLYEMAKAVNSETYFIETKLELQKEWYLGKKKIGISAGASTPSWIIEEVMEMMMEDEKSMEAMEMEETMESLFVDHEKELHAGEIVTGVVVQEIKGNLIVDIGLKAEGILAIEEFGDNPIPGVGEEVTAVLLQKSNSEGQPVLSKRKLEDRKRRDKQRDALKTLPTIFENKEELKGVVLRTTKSGLIVECGDIECFMPASQVVEGFVKNLDKFVGEEVRVRIIDLDLKKRLPKIVVSQKVILSEERAVLANDFWSNVEVGSVLNGEVKRMTDFGAFVSLGFLDGLLHVSEISWDKRKSMKDVIAIGDMINVKVIGLDKEQNKVSLSMKALEDNPWAAFLKNHKAGHIVKGRINSIVEYGAFVEVGPCVEGLLHISEVSHERIDKIADVLKVGDEVEVEILDIDEDKKKVSLSKKALEDAPVKEEVQEQNETVYESNDEAVTIGDMLADLNETTESEDKPE